MYSVFSTDPHTWLSTGLLCVGVSIYFHGIDDRCETLAQNWTVDGIPFGAAIDFKKNIARDQAARVRFAYFFFPKNPY